MSKFIKLLSSTKTDKNQDVDIETGYKITNSSGLNLHNPTVIGKVKTGFHIDGCHNGTIHGAIVASSEKGAIFLRTIQALSSANTPEANHIKELINNLYSTNDQAQKKLTYQKITSYMSDHMTILAPFWPLIDAALKALVK